MLHSAGRAKPKASRGGGWGDDDDDWGDDSWGGGGKPASKPKPRAGSAAKPEGAMARLQRQSSGHGGGAFAGASATQNGGQRLSSQSSTGSSGVAPPHALNIGAACGGSVARAYLCSWLLRLPPKPPTCARAATPR